MTQEDKEILKLVIRSLEDGKAGEPVILDLRSLTTMTDYFVLAHGTNTRQVQAMARDIEEVLKTKAGLKPHHVEGLAAAQWVLMDYGHFIVHLFLSERRGYYDLERIWMDAPRITP